MARTDNGSGQAKTSYERRKGTKSEKEEETKDKIMATGSIIVLLSRLKYLNKIWTLNLKQ